jgi:hypothetical protein
MSTSEKSGYKKSEFWMGIFGMILLTVVQLMGKSTVDYTTTVGAIVLLYIGGRSTVKSFLARGTIPDCSDSVTTTTTSLSRDSSRTNSIEKKEETP